MPPEDNLLFEIGAPLGRTLLFIIGAIVVPLVVRTLLSIH